MRDPKIVSYTMSRIKCKDTLPEIKVRKYLFSKGLRFRKNDKRYPGSPDIVLPKYKTIVFINGCFWHMHEGYECFKLPTTRQEFWKNKLTNNRKRDETYYTQLKQLGWKVIIVWECELKPSIILTTLNKLYNDIISN